jgi:hypothetical protein
VSAITATTPLQRIRSLLDEWDALSEEHGDTMRLFLASTDEEDEGMIEEIFETPFAAFNDLADLVMLAEGLLGLMREGL